MRGLNREERETNLEEMRRYLHSEGSGAQFQKIQDEEEDQKTDLTLQ